MHWSEIKESFRMALASLAVHKLRSALTLLGILVGVFSIILVMTAMRVLQQNIESELTQLGTDTFQVQRWPAIRVDEGGWEKFHRRQRLTYEQARRLQQQATLPLDVGIEATFSRSEIISRYAKTNPNIQLLGVTPETFSAKNWKIETGRGLLGLDIEQARYMCVLGGGVAEKLFPYGSAVNEKVKFRGINYHVVGVLESKGGMFGATQDDFIAIPITTALNQFDRNRDLAILVRAPNQEMFEDTIEQVRGILRKIRLVPPGEDDDFEIFSNDSLIDQFRAITLAVRLGMAVISSIALLAAGVGIMNIMLVSVTERTREIGIRRAIGAKKRSILMQFILEAVVLCQIGGVLGVGLGIVSGNVAAVLLKVSPVIPFDWVAIGLLICSAVGVIFGTYPAIKAANLDPIESLRYE
jgi:putative ABC transport system permease protein